VIGVAALDPQGDPAVTARLAQALETASPPAGLLLLPVVRTVTLPAGIDSPGAVDIQRDAPDAVMLLAWEPAESSLIRVYVLAPPAPPALAQIDVGAPVWDMPTPGIFPLIMDTQAELDFVPALVLGLLEIATGEPGQAEVHLAAFAESLPQLPGRMSAYNEAALSFVLARLSAQNGDLIQSLEQYSQALRLRSDFAAALVNRGNIYLKAGDVSAALDGYNSALAAMPDHPAALYNRALAYRALGDLPLALEDSERLFLLYEAVWSANLHGLIAYEQGDYETALSDFLRAGELAPDDPIPLFNQALTLARTGEHGQALVVLDALIELQPGNPVFQLYLGDAYRLVGEAQEAEQAYRMAIELDPAYVEAYLQRGWLRASEGNLEGALADAAQALALDPQSGRAYWIRGDALLAQEDFGAAQDAYSAALSLGESDPAIYAARGWALHRLGFRSGAIEDYEQALASGYSDAVMLSRLGFALYDAGRYEESLPVMLAAVDAGLDTADGYAGLSLALDANIRRDEAEQEYIRALEIDDQYGKASFLVEQPLWSQQAVTRAVTILRRLGIDPYSE
jgi:tetratricopeptide (TPR) repeat protein